MALQELTVQAQEQAVPAVDLADGIYYLNTLMAMYDADGVKLGYTVVTDPNQVLTVPAGAIMGVTKNLAIYMANNFDIEVSASLAATARKGEQLLYKLGVSLNKQNYPSTLPIGSGNEDGAGYDLGQTFFNGCCEDVDTCEDS